MNLTSKQDVALIGEKGPRAVLILWRDDGQLRNLTEMGLRRHQLLTKYIFTSHVWACVTDENAKEAQSQCKSAFFHQFTPKTSLSAWGIIPKAGILEVYQNVILVK